MILLYMYMRTNYSEWLLYRILEECNKALILEAGEESIPELEMRIKDFKKMPSDLLLHYRKEENIQRPHGGIRNPPMVLCNKIRHEFTNYDHVRDSMTDAVRSGDMDRCRELELRIILTKKVKTLVDALINSLPNSIQVNSQIISRNQLFQANDRYTFRESGNIAADLNQSRCK